MIDKQAVRPIAIRSAAILGVVVVAVAAIGSASGFVVYTLAGGLAFALTALSIVVVTGYLGQISLAPAAFMGIGAFTTAVSIVRFEVPFGLAAVVGTLIGALAGAVVALPALRVQGLLLAVTTMAFAASMDYTLFSNEWFTGFPAGMMVPRPYMPGIDLSDDRTFFWALATAVIVVAIAIRLLRSTWIGRCWAAIRDEEVAASVLGISVSRAKVTAFAISAGIAAFGGSAHVALVGFVNGGPSTSYSAASSLALAVMVTLIGPRSVSAAVAAGIMYAAVPLVVDELWGETTQGLQWAAAVMSVLLILTLMFHSQGLVHWVEDVLRLRRDRSSRAAAIEYDDVPLPTVATTGPSDDRPVLSVRNIDKSFGGLDAVCDVSLDVVQGEVVALIGPNGAGKTTLFNAVSGLLSPSAGSVCVNGTDLDGLGPHNRAAIGVGRTFQVPRVWANLTGWEHVWLASEASRRQMHKGSAGSRAPVAGRRAADRTAVEVGRLSSDHGDSGVLADELLGSVGLRRYRDVRAAEMSLGTIRRLELARALATRPRVLLLDEPSSGLDAYAVQRFAELIRQLCEELELAVLVVEHNTAFVRSVADRAVAMSFGSIVAEGTVEAVYGNRAVLDSYLGRAVREEAR